MANLALDADDQIAERVHNSHGLSRVGRLVYEGFKTHFTASNWQASLGPSTTPLLHSPSSIRKGVKRTSRASTALVKSTRSGLRMAVAAVFCSLFVLVPSIRQQMDPNYGALVGSSVMLMAIFTSYKNLGISCSLAWQGFVGTLIACLFSHTMNVIMPLGARGDHYIPILAHALNVGFIVLTLWLNFSVNATMFILSNHCYFIMEFMNPSSTAQFNTGWSINIDAMTTTTLVTASIGIFLGVLTMILPSPIRAIHQCRREAILTTEAVLELVEELSEFYGRADKSVVVARCDSKASHLSGLLANMHVDLDGAWLEDCLGLLRTVTNSRLLLGQHLATLKEMSGNAFALQCCLAKEDFDEAHAKCMDGMRKQVQDVLQSTRILLTEATSSAVDGNVDAEERATLQSLIRPVQDAVKELAVAFCKVRKDISPTAVIDRGLNDENVFVYCLSVHARFAVSYSETMLSACQISNPSLFGSWKSSVRSLIDPNLLLWDRSYRSFALRNSLSVLVAFYIGFWLLDYSAIVAGTVSLLISSFVGSAMQKNLGRIQGVVIGNIMPHILQQMIGQSCRPWRIAVQGVALGLWEWFTNYIYYSNADQGYIALLAAAFGGNGLTYPCDDHVSAGEEALFESQAYKKITETTIAAFIVLFVDMVLAPGRASTMATEGLFKAMLFIDAGYQASFEEKDADGRLVDGPVKMRKGLSFMQFSKASDASKKVVEYQERDPGQILTLLTTTEALASEAHKEPRHYRDAWPNALFGELVKSCHVLRAFLHQLENVQKRSDGVIDNVMHSELKGLKSYDAVKHGMLTRMEAASEAAHTTLTNIERGYEDRDFELDSIQKLESLLKGKREITTVLKAIPELIKEINAKSQYPVDAPNTMEDDRFCRMAVMMTILDVSAGEMAAMVNICVKMA